MVTYEATWSWYDLENVNQCLNQTNLQQNQTDIKHSDDDKEIWKSNKAPVRQRKLAHVHACAS